MARFISTNLSNQSRPALARYCRGLLFITVSLLATLAVSQDDSSQSIDSQLELLAIPPSQLPRCFGMSDIVEPRALGVCDALNLKQNVRARELSENWVRAEPNSPAAQFALAEVLFTVEGNMPRALFHLNRSEELTNYTTLVEAIASGNVQWHYLALSQLSYVHQLMGDQLQSLQYLEKISEIYGQEVESLRGWPLIKLQEFELARASANLVLQNSENERERSRAWNTLCAVELASLQPIESMTSCNRAIDEDEGEALLNDRDTVYLSNASEVSLSLLEMEQAEDYLDRATRYLNPNSVADPWIYKLYITMNQGRFDEARSALDSMLVWRESQIPIVAVMNRAEHFLVSASFLMLAGYAEDAIRLTTTALNQPDRNGSYSADAAQKDAIAALLNMMANATEYQIQQEKIATMDFTESIRPRLAATSLRVDGWRAARRAASLFADFEVLQSRLRPYSPLDVHVPEWVEPELIALMGTGVMSSILEQANSNGAFQLNQGYYYAYKAEIAAQEQGAEQTLAFGERALAELPQQEVLLKARVSAHMGKALWALDQYEAGLAQYELALQWDPSIIRRLAASLPVTITGDGSDFARQAEKYLAASPRFRNDPNGFILEINTSTDLSACLKSRAGNSLSCYNLAAAESQSSKWNAQQLVQQFHTETFGLGYDISKAQRSMLLGSGVYLNAQSNATMQQSKEAVLDR
jgi:hypothetical protein